MSWGVATQNGVSVSLASIVSLSCGATEFSPASLFTSGVAGAWYDPSDINNYMAGLGPELVAPIDFNTGWTASGAAITVNSATSFTSAGVSNYYNTPFTVGRWYAVTINATFTGSTLNLYNAASATNQITPLGLTSGVAQTFYFLALATQFNIRQSSAGTVTVNSIAVAELTGIANATLFQDSAGTTPVTAVEQPVGLMLDKSQGLVLGSELVTNGDFSGGTTGWTAGNSATLSTTGGKLSVVNGAVSLGQGRQTITTVAGKTYKLSVTFTSVSASRGYVFVGTFAGDNSRFSAGPLTTSQTVTGYFTAAGTSTYLSIGNADNSIGLEVQFDDVTVKDIAGNHALQATSASRPILRARYNLLTYSEQFDNAAWVKTAGISAFGSGSVINAATAPDGTQTADLIVESAAGAGSIQHSFYQTFSVSAATYTLTIFAKPASGATRYLSIYPQGAGTAYAVFNLASQTVSFTGGANYLSSSIVEANNGFYRCVITFSAIAGTIFTSAYISDSAVAQAPSYVGDGASGFYIWGAMLNTGSAAGTYQRIAAATDYATAGFLPYLALDGGDDWMASGSINFSATDKMSMCFGVTKLSDALVGMVTELSADYGTNAGSFYFAAPETTGASGDFSINARGSTSGARVSSIAAAPVTRVATGLIDIAAPSKTLRLNGSQVDANSASMGTGNFGNYPLYIGRRGGASLPFNGRIYQMVVCGKTLSASELASTEAYVNARTGAY